MDERLEKALNFSNFMVTLNNQKRLLLEKYNEDLLYFYKGSQFSITHQLITFVSMLNNREVDQVVLTDDNELPTKIDNVSEFLENILDKYFSASNNYYAEYESLKKNRKIVDLIELDD